jgi:putative DNA primase/helicase
MVPTARLIFATNELPPINDRSDGIWRRMIAMPFTRQFGEDERDLDRSARLMAELPGIFNWALEGAVRLFGQRGFTRCRVCEQCAGEHRQHSDSFLEFMDEMVEVRSDKEVSTDEFYRAYVDYCENNGRRPKSNTEVGKQVLRLGGVSRKRRSTGDRKYEYRGIGLRFNARLPFNLGSTSSYRRPMPLPPISDN